GVRRARGRGALAARRCARREDAVPHDRPPRPRRAVAGRPLAARHLARRRRVALRPDVEGPPAERGREHHRAARLRGRDRRRDLLAHRARSRSMTRILCLVLLALAVAPAALADGYAPLATQNGEGVATPDGTTRFVAVGQYNSTDTLLAKIDARTGV